MKSNTPFAIWARSEDAQTRGVSLAEAKKRVTMFTFNPKSYAPREVKAFKQAVIARLQQTEDDAAIDNRSIEYTLLASNQRLVWIVVIMRWTLPLSR